MTGRNTGTKPFGVTEALHPYFAVADQTKCLVTGENDAECRLEDPVSGRSFAFTQSGAAGYYIWRPNSRSHLSKSVSPIRPDDWRRFICVENGTMKRENAYVLKPGECHTLVRTVRLLKH